MRKTGKTYLIDTNIIIDFFSNDLELKEKLSVSKILIPSVVVGELYFGAYASLRTKSKISEIEEFIKECEIVYVDIDTAKYYGKVKSQLKKSGTPIPENDVWIAALSLQHKAVVATRDKHFDKPEDIKVEYW
jgi:tRNA(fMet)-specific endonuclease VapC